MLISKYNKFIFYSHKFGNYDFFFIIKVLTNFNTYYFKKNNQNYYYLDVTTRDSNIIKLTVRIINSNISKKDNVSKYNKYISITFVDSYNLLCNSLDSLTKDFNSNTQKGIFPYSFVNRDTLNYEGIIPHISYYNLTKLTSEKKNLFLQEYKEQQYKK